MAWMRSSSSSNYKQRREKRIPRMCGAFEIASARSRAITKLERMSVPETFLDGGKVLPECDRRSSEIETENGEKLVGYTHTHDVIPQWNLDSVRRG